jgi:hypothetical protein
MRQKKRYLLLRSFPSELPPNSKFLFQNSLGYVIKTDLEGAESLRSEALLISGSIWKLKEGRASKSPLSEKRRRN